MESPSTPGSMRCYTCGAIMSEGDRAARQALLDQRVVWATLELNELLQLEHELTPHAREALLAVCADVAGKLERGKLQGRGQKRH